MRIIGRRTFLARAGVLLLCAPDLIGARRAQPATITVLSAPLELIGDWDGSPTSAAAAVISRMREVSLSGVRLLSDRQPERLRVDEHSSGSPAIWLHKDPPTTAWIIVDIGARGLVQARLSIWPRAWTRHMQQLGGPGQSRSRHPNGSKKPWSRRSRFRGLGLLAASWEANPPFPGDAAFANSIRKYRTNQIAEYEKSRPPTEILPNGSTTGRTPCRKR